MALAKLQRIFFGEDRSHVAEAHGHVREGKNRVNFQNKMHCKLQDIIKIPPDFSRENSIIFVKWISSFAVAKTTFFQKHSKRWRGFPPEGMFLLCFAWIGKMGRRLRSSTRTQDCSSVSCIEQPQM